MPYEAWGGTGMEDNESLHILVSLPANGAALAGVAVVADVAVLPEVAMRADAGFWGFVAGVLPAGREI
jgi:hypothetical protein